MEKACENCYYSKNAVRDDLMYCSYIGDTIGDGKDNSIAEHVIDSLRFKGFVYEGYVDFGGELVLKPCVTLKSQCRKFNPKKI